MNFFHGLFIGAVMASMVTGVFLIQAEKKAHNFALSKAGQAVMEGNQFAGLDNTYDLGYKRCQDQSFGKIVELKRE